MGTKKHFKTWTLATACAILLTCPGLTFARVLYVDDDAPGPGDGSSWATAFQYLQDALAVATAGDEIHVAQGRYLPDQGAGVTPGDRRASFQMVDSVTVLGGFAGLAGADPDLREPGLFTTILTGDLQGDDDPNGPLRMSNGNSYHVVTVGDGHNTLDGVTITRGIARDRSSGGLSCYQGDFLARNCTFLENWSDDEAGGIENLRGTVRLENCRFIRNEAWTGGGLSNCYGAAQVIDCEFIDNYAGGGGGGIHNEGGDLRIERSRFLRNRAADGTAGLYNDAGSVEVITSEFVENHADKGAGAVANLDGDMDFFHCVFRGNSAHNGTGGIANRGELRLLYCTLVGNYAEGYTGALSCNSGGAIIAHCLFNRNTGKNAGGIFVQDASLSLDQCTFYFNIAMGGLAGGVYWGGTCCPSETFSIPASGFTATGCIFWANHTISLPIEGGAGELIDEPVESHAGYAAQINVEPDVATVEYSCIGGWTPERGGMGNLGTDPLFVAPDQNDLHLKSRAGHWDAVALAWVADDVTSPCIDAGDPNRPVEQEPSPNGGRVNMGAYGGTSEASKSWFGAEPCATIDAADLNGDCRVDAEDYRLATQRWPQVGQ